MQELQPLIIGSLSQLIRTLSLQAVLLELTKTVVGLDTTGLAAAAHQAGHDSNMKHGVCMESAWSL